MHSEWIIWSDQAPNSRRVKYLRGDEVFTPVAIYVRSEQIEKKKPPKTGCGDDAVFA
jgi:hypothetical protein